MVLGGYSQGAAVMGFVTSSQVPDGAHLVQALQPMPSDLTSADRGHTDRRISALICVNAG